MQKQHNRKLKTPFANAASDALGCKSELADVTFIQTWVRKSKLNRRDTWCAWAVEAEGVAKR